VTQTVETCALSRTIFEAWSSFRVTCAKLGGNAGKTPPVSRTRRALPAMRSSSGAGARAWVQVTLFQHTPAVSPPAIARLGSDPSFSGLQIVMGCPWHDIRIVTDAGGHWRNISSELPASVSKMGEVVQFIPKPAPDRAARLIQEARAIYESIFPTETPSIAPIEDDDTSS